MGCSEGMYQSDLPLMSSNTVKKPWQCDSPHVNGKQQILQWTPFNDKHIFFNPD